MIGLWSAYAGTFLLIASLATIVFALPMLISPLAWARALGWRRPADTDLAVYFGRCLGGVVTVLGAMGCVAARRPAVQPFFFDVMLTMVAVNIGVHAWGAVARIQPLSETIEIAVWVVLLLAGLAFHPL